MKKKEADFSNVPESDCIVNYIVDRYRKGLYTLVLVTGLPGTGKSSTCMRLSELIAEKLHGKSELKKEDLVDSLLGLLKRIRMIKKPGEIIDIEELSVLFPARRSMAAENVAIGRILDTCRKKQVILLSNAPIFNSIDSHIRAMAHVLIETQKIYKKQGVVISKSWKLQTNPHSGKTYRHRFTRGGRDIALFITRKPNAKVWEEYEKQKDTFLDTLYSHLEKQTEKKQEKVNKELGIHPKRIIKKEHPLNPRYITIFGLAKNKGMKYKDIAKMEGCSIPRIAQIIKIVEKNTNLS